MKYNKFTVCYLFILAASMHVTCEAQVSTSDHSFQSSSANLPPQKLEYSNEYELLSGSQRFPKLMCLYLKKSGDSYEEFKSISTEIARLQELRVKATPKQKKLIDSGISEFKERRSEAMRKVIKEMEQTKLAGRECAIELPDSLFASVMGGALETYRLSSSPEARRELDYSMRKLAIPSKTRSKVIAFLKKSGTKPVRIAEIATIVVSGIAFANKEKLQELPSTIPSIAEMCKEFRTVEPCNE